MTHIRQIEDTLDCGGPEETFEALITHLRTRAHSSRSIAKGLERDMKDAMEQASTHMRAADEFELLADALQKAPVTFAAKAIEAQRAETAETGSVADESGAPKGFAQGDHP